MKFDAIVLGAGIIGVSVAIHLQKRGRLVALVDRKQPGNETSFGNAGLIQREGVYPYGFPRDIASLFKYALNRSPEVRYNSATLLRLAPFLWSYWRNSHPKRHANIAHSYASLIQHSVSEHHDLANAAGAMRLFHANGWLAVFRTPKKQQSAFAFAEKCRAEHGIKFDYLNAAALQNMEPHLDSRLIGALHYQESETISDPGALVTAYAEYFKGLGGRFFLGDAQTLSGNWQVKTEQGLIRSDAVVIALGPWSDEVTSRLGYRLPLAVKRGYHMNYDTHAELRLNHPILDAENGYVLAPMNNTIRLTTGIEFAHRDARHNPAQLDLVEPIARSLFPINKRLQDQAWMGSRPCTPDMLPIIGAAPAHDNLWFAFGHAHHGLTLGPVTGRLLAEMMTDEEFIVNPLPFSPSRFVK